MAMVLTWLSALAGAVGAAAALLQAVSLFRPVAAQAATGGGGVTVLLGRSGSKTANRAAPDDEEPDEDSYGNLGVLTGFVVATAVISLVFEVIAWLVIYFADVRPATKPAVAIFAIPLLLGILGTLIYLGLFVVLLVMAPYLVTEYDRTAIARGKIVLLGAVAMLSAITVTSLNLSGLI
ncbi:hypothetical protein ACFQO7_14555 [Catellatospora aurea]|uniref:Sap-like sulfolipid-1-addressing protein n=1 Tax=Catellatospora aurea TaxID=1337874 RepID=A0ABW2GYC2_9ACTN